MSLGLHKVSYKQEKRKVCMDASAHFLVEPKFSTLPSSEGYPLAFLDEVSREYVETMIAVFNKSIPRCIGYSYHEIESYFEGFRNFPDYESRRSSFREQHRIDFEGKIDEIGAILLRLVPRSNLKAVALEFDIQFVQKENQKICLGSTIDFTVSVFWENVCTTYDGNYSQSRYSRTHDLVYDIHTHTAFQLKKIEILQRTGSHSLKEIFDATAAFFNNTPFCSAALKGSPPFQGSYMSSADPSTARAEVWSQPFLAGQSYIYI